MGRACCAVLYRHGFLTILHWCQTTISRICSMLKNWNHKVKAKSYCSRKTIQQLLDIIICRVFIYNNIQPLCSKQIGIGSIGFWKCQICILFGGSSLRTQRKSITIFLWHLSLILLHSELGRFCFDFVFWNYQRPDVSLRFVIQQIRSYWLEFVPRCTKSINFVLLVEESRWFHCLVTC